jgi:transcription termination factor Rho
MSEPVLERSVLERKERDELQTIARAMGAEPGSRARKADLVDIILSKAGIATDPGPASNGGSTSPTRRRRTTTAKADAPVNGSPAAEADEAPAAEAAPDDVPAPEAAAEPAAEVSEAPATNGKVEDASTTEPVGAVESSAAEVEAPPAPERETTERRPQGDDRGGPQANRGPREEDAEPGNRRRRRRGRDRDRGERGGQGGQGPDREPRGEQGGRPEEPFVGEPVEVAGLLDLRDEGYGFLRTKGYLASKEDSYVSVKQVRQFGLRKGDHIVGASRPAQRNEKNPALLRIDLVNGKDPEEARRRPRFEDLTPLFPDERLRLESATDPGNMTARIVDLIAPIGKGQRGMIVSPPKAGKTTVIKQIVKSIEANNPEVHLMVLLVDERPEEVTDMRRSTNGEVIASTFDRPSDEHTALSELTIDRAKRLVEEGRDVVIVLDGITRLARAYNLAAPATGRIMSGGVDSGALYPPKRFFGAARNIEEGGSLTILATALVDTGSRMDEVIFEEFKGTGNMELRLDRRLAERRIYPAIDVDASSTRHEELLFDRKQLQQVWRVRRALNALSAEGASPAAALERMMDGLKQFGSNEEFLAEAARTGGGPA